MGFFALFSIKDKLGYVIKLMTMSPHEDQTSMNADEHIAFLTNMVGVFERSLENIVVVKGNNVITSTSILMIKSILVYGSQAIH